MVIECAASTVSSGGGPGESLLRVLLKVLVVAGALAGTQGRLSAGPRRSVVAGFLGSFAAGLPGACGVTAGGALLACGSGCSGAGVEGLKALEGDVQMFCPGLRRAVGGAGWRWRPPLQDFLQVKVGAKAMDVGQDPRPCKPQELPALGVDELRDFGRGFRQLFSQLAEEERIDPSSSGMVGRVSPSMPRRFTTSMMWAENPRNICMRCLCSMRASALEFLASWSSREISARLSMYFVSQEYGVPRDGPKDSNARG
jgi:hypothetical protein